MFFVARASQRRVLATAATISLTRSQTFQQCLTYWMKWHSYPKVQLMFLLIWWQVLLTTLRGKRPRGWRRTMWFGYISDLAWSFLGLEAAEQSEIARKLLGIWLLRLRPSWQDNLIWKWMAWLRFIARSHS